MIVWLNPVAGVSGDMLLGALLDLGAPMDAIRDALAPLDLPGARVSTEDVYRQGLRARRAVVHVDDDATERPAAVLLDLVARATPRPVADLATRAVRALAETEAAIHGQPVSDVHLHEIGGLDTVLDTVGVAAALHALGVTRVYSAPIALGSGVVPSAHGLLPVPAPATIALIAGAEVYGVGPVGETVTPTGAALLRAMGCRYQPPPSMTVRAVGYGAGSRDPADRPNLLPATLGEPGDAGAPGASLTLLETTVDDVTGEAIGAAIARLLEAGAVDAWTVPATGKKGRPAHVVSALARPADADALVDVLARWTGTLGVRLTPVERRALPRRTVEVEVGGHPVRVKVGPYGAKPEHDDVLAVSRAVDRPPAVVVAAALAEMAKREEMG